MFEMGAHTMALPLEEKMKFEQGDGGTSFGYIDPPTTLYLLKRPHICRYKFAGANATDASGAPDSVEFINISKDDALAFPTVVNRRYPLTVEERMDSAVRPFVRKSMEVNQTLISILNDRLGLPAGCLAKMHVAEEHSGCEARCIKKTPEPTPEPPDRAAIGAHTDFGSIVRTVDGACLPSFQSKDGNWSAYVARPWARQSFLHNRLGDLQVLPPGTDDWKYVKVCQWFHSIQLPAACTVA